MKSEVFDKYNLKLKTLSPVFISDDKVSNLSPYTDFVFQDGELIIIDENKFTKELEKDLQSINEYVDGVKQMENTRSKFNLLDFINNRLNIDLEKLEKERFTINGNIGKEQIAKSISSLGRQFIPGSSLKGAIRTAIIYDWLLNTQKGKEFFNGLIKKINELYDELNKLNGKKENGERLDDKDFRRFRKLEKNVLSILNRGDKEINENENGFNEENIFGLPKSLNGYESRFIQISDSELIEPGNKEILQLKRIKLATETDVVKLWSEVIKSGTETSLSINIIRKFQKEELKKFNSGKITELFDAINKFSKSCIENEIEQLKNIKRNNALVYQTAINWYNDLKKLITESENSFAVLRIGSGKTYFDNSIGLAIKNNDNETFTKFRKLLRLGFDRNGNFANYFPSTRTIFVDTNSGEDMPIGWIVIYTDDKEQVINKFSGTQEKSLKENKVKEKEGIYSNDPLSRLKEKFKVTES